MTEMGAATKSADDKTSFKKHYEKEIKLLEKRLKVAEKTISFQESRIPALEKELELKRKIYKIINRKPAKLTVDYEYEEDPEYEKLIREKQELAFENDIANFEHKLWDAKRALGEFKESYEDDIKILVFKKQELEKLMGE